MNRGRILAIHIHAHEGDDPHAINEAKLIAGRGIDGDVNHALSEMEPERGINAVTLIETEAIEAVRRDYGIELTAAESRRNVQTEGVALNHLVGRRFRVGTALCEGMELCEPCGYLESKTRKGVTKALLHRGGLRARILEGGVARPGDTIEPVG
ncbi:MOSC domain-containing protein [bacterium]|nr:MOSC domain-containing protein [bacterium]